MRDIRRLTTPVPALGTHQRREHHLRAEAGANEPRSSIQAKVRYTGTVSGERVLVVSGAIR